MINKYKFENNSVQSAATSSIFVTSSQTYSHTTTSTSSGEYSRSEYRAASSRPLINITNRGNLSSNLTIPNGDNLTPSLNRLTAPRSSYHGEPTLSYSSVATYRSAFNQPIASYRSFNTGSRLQPPVENPPPKKSKSFLALFKSSDKDDKLSKDKEKEKQEKEKKEKEKKEKEKNEKEKKEKEKKEQEKREREKKEKEKKEKKEKDKKESKKENGASSSVVRPAALDAKPNPYPALGNSDSNNTYFLGPEEKLTIKVMKTGEFYPIVPDIVPTYETKSRYSRGNVLLINNINFPSNKYRGGAQVDHDNISTLFKKMGFRVTDHKNKSKTEMEKIITNYGKLSTHKSADINVTVIMSHGNGYKGDTYIETIDDKIVGIDWIVEQFNNEACPNLANKPKIFIFQCCRGDAKDVVQTDSKVFTPPRKNADMLLAFATVPGFVSYRDPKLGTWYIQAICKIFMEHAHDKDVENLLKIVDDNLNNYTTRERQTSSYENRGFKRCFLNPL